MPRYRLHNGCYIDEALPFILIIRDHLHRTVRVDLYCDFGGANKNKKFSSLFHPSNLHDYVLFQSVKITIYRWKIPSVADDEIYSEISEISCTKYVS